MKTCNLGLELKIISRLSVIFSYENKHCITKTLQHQNNCIHLIKMSEPCSTSAFSHRTTSWTVTSLSHEPHYSSSSLNSQVGPSGCHNILLLVCLRAQCLDQFYSQCTYHDNGSVVHKHGFSYYCYCNDTYISLLFQLDVSAGLKTIILILTLSVYKKTLLCLLC